MLNMMVLARRVGAETQLQRVTAGWWNQLMWETVDSTVLELCSKQWSLHQRCLLAWRLVFVTFGCVTLPRRFRLGIVFGGEVWRSGDSPSLTSMDVIVYLFTVLCGFARWSSLDGVGSRMTVEILSDVLFVVLTLVYSGLEFSRCQRCI